MKIYSLCGVFSQFFQCFVKMKTMPKWPCTIQVLWFSTPKSLNVYITLVD